MQCSMPLVFTYTANYDPGKTTPALIYKINQGTRQDVYIKQ